MWLHTSLLHFILSLQSHFHVHSISNISVRKHHKLPLRREYHIDCTLSFTSYTVIFMLHLWIWKSVEGLLTLNIRRISLFRFWWTLIQSTKNMLLEVCSTFIVLTLHLTCVFVFTLPLYFCVCWSLPGAIYCNIYDRR